MDFFLLFETLFHKIENTFTIVKEKSINKRVGEQIRMIRLGQNLSQEALADELKLSVSTLSNLERGETEFTVTRLYQFLAVLKVDIHYFLNMIHIEPQNNALNEDPDVYKKKGSSTDKLEEEIRLIKLELTRLKNR